MTDVYKAATIAAMKLGNNIGICKMQIVCEHCPLDGTTECIQRAKSHDMDRYIMHCENALRVIARAYNDGKFMEYLRSDKNG